MENKSLIPTKEEFDILQGIAKAASESKFFDKLGGIGGLLSIALYAKEINMPPMTAIYGGFSSIQGKITMSADMMHVLLRRAGIKLRISCTNEKCEIYGKRPDGDDYTATFTMEDAKRANLAGKDNWVKNPSDMLFARCISRLKRRLAPEVGIGGYVEGEIEEIENEVLPAKEAESPIVEPVKELLTTEKTSTAKITGDEAYKIEEALAHTPELRTRILDAYRKKAFDEFNVKQAEYIWKRIEEEKKRQPSKDDDMVEAL